MALTLLCATAPDADESRPAGRAATPFSSHDPEEFHWERYIMKGRDNKVPREPIGIVIAGLPSTPPTTVFSAYVWGPAPTTAEEPEPQAG